jgi:hypothetical protein
MTPSFLLTTIITLYRDQGLTMEAYPLVFYHYTGPQEEEEEEEDQEIFFLSVLRRPPPWVLRVRSETW